MELLLKCSPCVPQPGNTGTMRRLNKKEAPLCASFQLGHQSGKGERVTPRVDKCDDMHWVRRLDAAAVGFAKGPALLGFCHEPSPTTVSSPFPFLESPMRSPIMRGSGSWLSVLPPPVTPTKLGDVQHVRDGRVVSVAFLICPPRDPMAGGDGRFFPRN